MKEAYYFSHDSNARSDSKIVRLRRKFGMEGYGIYFAIIEMLREDSAHKLLLSGFEDIAYDLRVDVAKVESVVKDFDLFVIENDYFYSPRLSRSMQKYYEMKRKRVEAGSVGGKKSKKVIENQEIESTTQANEDTSDKQNLSNTQAMLKQNESTPQALKERKGKEKKVNESKRKEIVIPTLEEVILFFDEKGYTEEAARKAFAHYEAGEWYDSNGNKVKNWKQKMNTVWFRDEHKKKEKPQDTIEQYRNIAGFDEQIHLCGKYYPHIINDQNGKRIKYIPNGFNP